MLLPTVWGLTSTIFHLYGFVGESAAQKFNPDNRPLVIWWSALLFPYDAEEKTKVIKCPSGHCLSCAKGQYKNNDVPVAYIFYGTDYTGNVLPLPRKANEVWALLHEESPMNNYIFSHSAGMRIFNFSATFSRESDFPLTTQHLPSLEYLVTRKPMSIGDKNKYRENGTAPVMYLQSHCNVASDRDRYVKQLMKFIDVDSYGTCLHNKDLPADLATTDMYNDKKLFDYISRYKFHISFENAICKDYITEKFYRALHVGSVPVYKGSPTIKDWLPNSMSAIIADDFEDPEELANFLLELDRDDQLYAKYLSYKEDITNDFLKDHMASRHWGVNDPDKLDFLQGFECYMCDKLWNLSTSSPASSANKNHMNCPQPHMSLPLHALKSDKRDAWLQETWPETYWFSLDQALSIERMLNNRENNTENFWYYVRQSKFKH